MRGIKSSVGALFVAATIFPCSAQPATLTPIYSFQAVPDGQTSVAGLLKVGGYFLGTTSNGGAASSGTVFRIHPNGSGYSTRYSFTGGSADGQEPSAALVRVGSSVYGTTTTGGANNMGTVFKCDTTGSNCSVLHSFGAADDGAYAYCTLVYAGGNFYGTTDYGGASGLGTVFKMDTGGNEVWVHSFSGGNDGGRAYWGVVRIGSRLYGTTVIGGSAGLGTIYRIKTDGTHFHVLHSFLGITPAFSDGALPETTIANDGGVLVGTTYEGGTADYGTVFKINPNGSGYAPLYSFAGGNDGANPNGDHLVQYASDPGFLYGTTLNYGGGTIYKIDLSGAKTTLYQFGSSGLSDSEGGFLDLNGALYGTASAGGSNNTDPGAIFKFTP